MTQRSPSIEPIALQWNYHTSIRANTAPKRVWRTSWPDGTFEIMSPEDFEKLSQFCAKFNIPLDEYVED